jgi:hypothetical protein
LYQKLWFERVRRHLVAVAAGASAIAAGASTIAAFKSLALARSTAAQMLESERRGLKHDIETTARTVQVEAQRAITLYERIKPCRTVLRPSQQRA